MNIDERIERLERIVIDIIGMTMRILENLRPDHKMEFLQLGIAPLKENLMACLDIENEIKNRIEK
jgi:hypothetical protein